MKLAGFSRVFLRYLTDSRLRPGKSSLRSILGVVLAIRVPPRSIRSSGNAALYLQLRLSTLPWPGKLNVLPACFESDLISTMGRQGGGGDGERAPFDEDALRATATSLLLLSRRGSLR